MALQRYTPRHPASCHDYQRYRNINLLSIDYAFRPRLRIRLTLGGRTLPRKPWIYGEQDSHLFYRYSCLHSHLSAVHPSSRPGFTPADNALLPPPPSRRRATSRGFGSELSPDHFRRRITRPVSCYALFKWWLPLSQHPGCLCNSTSLKPLSPN